MLRDYNLRWIKANSLSTEQRFRFMNIYFAERMRERSIYVKERMNFILNKAVRENGYNQWLRITSYARLGFVLAIYRELTRHSDLIESEADQRAEIVRYTRNLDDRARKILEKANLVAGNRTDEFINVEDIDITTEEKIHDFQQQVQLTLDYLESQKALDE